MARLLNKILQLSPTLFEQLVYDLTVLSGLTNVTWRTPGSDGGRDIEGEYQATDFSGILRLERWYVECKRYTAAIDWPTVHNKIAHASAFGADYLLICTTSTLSPSCKDALSAYTRQHERPRVRAWEGPEMELRVQREAALLLKYGLGGDRRDVDSALAPVNDIVAKLVHVAYGEQSAVGFASSSVEAASAVAELVGRLSKVDPKSYPTSRARRLRQDDIYQWIDQEGSPGELVDRNS
jgi:Restriction endonuclease